MDEKRNMVASGRFAISKHCNGVGNHCREKGVTADLEI